MGALSANIKLSSNELQMYRELCCARMTKRFEIAQYVIFAIKHKLFFYKEYFDIAN